MSENDFKCVYFDNEKRYCDCGMLFNLNGVVERKVNKLDGVLLLNSTFVLGVVKHI